MIARRLALLAAALVASTGAGCLGLFGDEVAGETVDRQQQVAEDLLGQEGQDLLSDIASPVPKLYAFPGQLQLPPVVLWINKTVGPEVTLSFEGDQDEGGMRYNAIVQTEDISKHIPPGQPVEIIAKLQWNAKEVNSADFDIYVDVPGVKTTYYPAKSEDMNWNVPQKTLTVNTVGVAGLPHLVGVEAASGKSKEDIAYTMRVEIHYVKDVLTPYLPWAFQVPANASGLIVESVKGAGDEHIRAKFAIIGPDDSLVAYVDYNDIAIRTESVLVPTKGPGEYVFYAYEMHGGFLSIRADAGLEKVEARPLERVQTTVALDNAPAPGMISRDWTFDSVVEGQAPPTEMSGQKEATFAMDGTYPLGVFGWIKVQGTLASQVRISSTAGLVHDLQRVLRYEDERGSIGYTGDGGINQALLYENLAKGAYKVEYVNNGQAEIGYTTVTYKR